MSVLKKVFGRRRDKQVSMLDEVWTDHGMLPPLTDFVPAQGPPKSGMDRETVLRKIGQVDPWFHHIEVGHGIVTPGVQGKKEDPTITRRVLQMLDLPEDLTGKTVLDIGAWDGYFSFEAERRNAKRVLAIDNFCKPEKKHELVDQRIELASRGFFIAREILGSRVEFREMDVYDVSPETVGVFDIVLFLGVLYHLRHPLLALERIASVTREMVVVESQFTPHHEDESVVEFYDKGFHGDPVTWWVPNRRSLEGMVRVAGFKRSQYVSNARYRIVVKGYKE